MPAPAPVSPDPGGLLAWEARLLEPAFRASSEVGALLAEDFVEFGSSGQTYDREQMLAALAGEPQTGPPPDRRLCDGQVRLLSPTVALVTYRIVRREPDGSEMQSLRCSIWRHADGRWQMAFHQGTAAARRDR